MNEIESLLLSLKGHDLLGLIGVNGTIKRFYYGGGVYSIFKGKQGNYLIKNHNNNGLTIPFSKFLIDIEVVKNYNDLEKLINSKNFTKITTDKEESNNQTQAIETFKNSLIEANFNTPFFENKLVERLKLKPLLDGYKSLLNSVLYFGNTNILLNKKEANFSNFDDVELIISNHLENREFNLRFKPNNEKWRTIKGAKNVGFYLKNENAKNTILYIVEGAKDGINTYLVSGYDVFAVDNKGSIPDKLIEIIESGIYREIRILNDRDDVSPFDSYKNKLKSFKNIYFWSWKKLTNEFENLANNSDITDVLSELFKTKTLRDLKREFNKFIKDRLESFESLAGSEKLKKSSEKFEYFKKTNNVKKIKKLLIDIYYEHKKSSNFKGLFFEISKFLIKHRTTFKHSQKLAINEYLSEITKEILETIEVNKQNGLISLINSPTGSGKSTLIREVAKIKRVLSISPLKTLNSESENEDIGMLEKTSNDTELEADLRGFKAKNKSLVMTTERFIIDYKLIYEVLIKDGYIDLIVFDEAHLIPQALNFRGNVVRTHEILKTLCNKVAVAYFSGTPTNFDDKLAYIEVKSSKKTYIDYEVSNKSLNAIVNEKLALINKGESILIYCGVTESVNEVTRYLRAGLGEINEKIDDVEIVDKDVVVVYLTSKRGFYFGDNEKILLENNLSNIPKDKKIILVATSKVGTGVNVVGLEHTIQYGATYNPENVLQLYARLRVNGTITVIPIKSTLKASNKRDKVIGLFNALNRYAKEFKTNSLKELIQKHPKFSLELKRISDLKEISINSIHKAFKEELTSLAYYKSIKIKTLLVDRVVVVDDILILENNYQNILETYNDIELDKQSDFILSEYAVNDIVDFSQHYNTTQVFNVINQSSATVKKFKTDENKLDIKAKKEESKSDKQKEIDRYFQSFTYSDYEKEKIYKLLKDVATPNIVNFVDKSVEDKKDYLRAKFEMIRTSKDMKIFVSFVLEIDKLFKELLRELEYREYITVNELIEIFTQKGKKLSARGSFKDEIQYLAENVENFLKTGKWKYFKIVKINYKQVKNVIKREFTNNEVALIKYLNDNQVKDLENFIKFSGENLSQLETTFREKRDGLEKLIENYLDLHSE